MEYSEVTVLHNIYSELTFYQSNLTFINGIIEISPKFVYGFSLAHLVLIFKFLHKNTT